MTTERIQSLGALGMVLTNGSYERHDVQITEEYVDSIDDETFNSTIAEIRDFMLQNPGEYPLGESKELTIIDKATNELSLGSKVLMETQLTAAKYVRAADGLLEKIIANGNMLNAELDASCNTAIAKMGAAEKEVDEKTKPIRAAMDMIRSELLECGKKIKSKREAIQQHRDAWARECRRREKEESDRIAAEAAKKKEINDVRATIEKQLFEHFSNHLRDKKINFNSWFSSFTLENFEVRQQSLREGNPIYESAHFILFKYAYYGSILTNDEVLALVKEVQSEDKFQKFNTRYQAEMLELKEEKIGQLTSKKNELTRIKEFEEEQERERLEQERLKAELQKSTDIAKKEELLRHQEESKQREIDAANARFVENERKNAREAEETAQANEDANRKLAEQGTKLDSEKAQANTMDLFASTQAITPVADAPKAKTVIKTTITSAVGILPIFQLWFDEVGMKMTPADLEKEFTKMFTYANKRANDKKAPLTIVNQFISYVEETKAVTERTKIS